MASETFKGMVDARSRAVDTGSSVLKGVNQSLTQQAMESIDTLKSVFSVLKTFKDDELENKVKPNPLAGLAMQAAIDGALEGAKMASTGEIKKAVEEASSSHMSIGTFSGEAAKRQTQSWQAKVLKNGEAQLEELEGIGVSLRDLEMGASFA